MNILKSEKGGITSFVIIAFIFIMTMLISMYMKNVNYQITTLQAEERIKDAYIKDFNVILASGPSYNISFYANGGTIETENKRVNKGEVIGELPKCTREGYGLSGWFTKSEGGEEVTSSTIITSDMDLYARWTTNKTKIGDTEYNTVAEAIQNAPTDKTETTIVLLADMQGSVTIGSGKNIVIDAQSYTMQSTGDTQVVINDGGIVHIKNGTIIMNGGNAAVNNQKGGRLLITGGTIISTAGKAAVYNDGGTIEISGNPVLISSAAGEYSSLPRATVQNQGTGGTITITGGTIIGKTCPGVSNKGKIIIGTKSDGNVDTSSPLIIGSTYGIVNLSGKSFKFYDGIFKGVTGAISGTTSELETNYRIDDTSTETIDLSAYGMNTATYHTAYLVPNE